MNNLNSILIEGNLVADPEMRYTPKGAAVCSFRVACNRYYKQDEEMQQEVSYFEITTWNRLAEVCKEYLTKGRGVRVVGRLKQDRWEDQEGKTRAKVHVIAEHVEFKPKFKSDDSQASDTAAEQVDAPDGAEDPQDFPEEELEKAAS